MPSDYNLPFATLADIENKAVALLQERAKSLADDHPATPVFLDFGKKAMMDVLVEDEASWHMLSARSKKLKTDIRLPHLNMEKLQLPPMPGIFPELQSRIQDSDSSASDIAEVVSTDPALTAWILRIVNSPLYGFQAKVETLSRAVAILGLNQLRNLAYGALVMSLFSHVSRKLDIESFWKHSLSCAVSAKLIATRQNKQHSEKYFVAGLLHDIGKLVLLSEYPDHQDELRTFFAAGASYQQEWNLLGIDHARLGAIVLRRWNFPSSLVRSVLFHHMPHKSKYHEEPSVIHIADIVSHVLSTEGWNYPQLNEKAWDKVHLCALDLHKICVEVEAQIEHFYTLFGLH